MLAAATVSTGSDAATQPSVLGADGTALERVRIVLKQNWDASLSYDILREPVGTEPPIFVGRKELLGPLVSAIEQPDRRGTYLVSGYRGAGKTSLVIEAARRARQKFDLEKEGWRLLPLVLNVSEVSASLSDASEDKAPPLQIDARRLLTALLRALRNKVPELEQAGATQAAAEVKRKFNATLVRGWTAARWRRLSRGENVTSPDPPKDLKHEISAVYRKARAAQYVEKSREGSESRLREAVESKLGIEVKNALTLAAVVTAVLALGVEGAVLFGSAAAALHAVAIALAGVAVVSFSRSRTVSRETARTESAEVELSFDYSIHQLENDLKDIFTHLQEHRLRTVVVLEELDKVDDKQGQQLDAVIRYFKNLFTQAPALFFFLTDKEYYDLVAKRIDDARRKRTYSIEHTFFTHRVFVNRPTVRDCLDYLRTVAVEDSEKQAIDRIIEADSYRVRDVESMDLREKLMRVLLFRAQDHIFDLKNEMRRYMRVDDDGTSTVECNAESLTSGEQALAIFQFLVEQKARAHAFRGGGEYGNEVLRNCLFAVFADAEPGQTTPPKRYYPVQGAAGDQVSASEARLITKAVDSLILDLQRGGVVDKDTEGGGIRWTDTAARFTPKADQLETYEQDLVEKLKAHAETLKVLAKGGALHTLVASATTVDDLVQRLNAKAGEPETSKTPLTREETNATLSMFEGEVARALTEAFEAHRQRLETRLAVTTLMPIEGGVAGSAWRFPGASGEPQPEPVVLLVYGTTDLVRQAVAASVSSLPPTQRFAIVNVLASTELSTGPPEDVRDQWRSLLGRESAERALITLVPLDEELDAEDAERRWTESTADELVFGSAWASEPWQAYQTPTPEATPPGPFTVHDASGETEHASFRGAFEEWLAGADPAICWIVPPPFGALEEVFTRPLDEGRFVAAVPAPTAVAQGPGSESPDRQARVESRRRLIGAGRIVVMLDRPALDGLSYSTPPLGVRKGLLPGTPRTAGLPEMARIAVAWAGPPDERLAQAASPAAVTTLWSTADEHARVELARLITQWDPEHARKLLEPAAEGDSPAAMRELVLLYLDRGNREQAQHWWERLAATSDREEIERLADELRRSESVAAVTLYSAAAELGSASAMRRLATDLLEREPEAAIAWRDRLVQSGDWVQIEGHARDLRDRDAEASRRLYSTAAQGGSTTAMERLILDFLAEGSSAARDWTERLLATRNLVEIKRIGSAVLEQYPKEGHGWAKFAETAESDPEVAAAVAEVLRPVDPELADSLLAKAKT